MPQVNVTAALAYAEVELGEQARSTAVLAYAEVEAGARARVSAILAYAEVEIVSSAVALPTFFPPAGVPAPEVYDEGGMRLGFLGQFSIRRAYVLNEVGSGQGVFPADDLLVTRGDLDVDHMILVRSPRGLPDWLGVITEIEYTPYEAIARCQEALVLFSRWNGMGYPVKRYPEGIEEAWVEMANPIDIISGDLARVNARNETIVRIGAISITQAVPVRLEHGVRKTVLDELIELQKVFGFDFWVEPSMESSTGRLLAKLYVSDRRGRDRRDRVVLWEGKSLGEKSRYRKYSTQYFSQDKGEMLEISVTDTSLWAYLGLGDTIGVRSYSLGPAGSNRSVRILGMEPDEETGELDLVVEIV
jgi:hypothetical protein